MRDIVWKTNNGSTGYAVAIEQNVPLTLSTTDATATDIYTTKIYEDEIVRIKADYIVSNADASKAQHGSYTVAVHYDGTTMDLIGADDNTVNDGEDGTVSTANLLALDITTAGEVSLQVVGDAATNYQWAVWVEVLRMHLAQ